MNEEKFYLNTSNDSITLDYNELSEGKFIASMKDYLGYIMEISSPLSNSEVYLSKIVEKLEKNPPASFSLEKEKTIKGWKEFSLVSYTKKEKDNNGERETKVEGLFELEEANLTNFHTKKEKKEKIFRKNEKYFPLISTSKVNNAVLVDFSDNLLTFIEVMLKQAMFDYGARQLDDNNIKGLKVKLPVVQRNDGDKDEPD
ncbi:16648_t:CDS:2 [Funneliformis geosporum]|uniref:16648_t:CDS:1 n=1 Tax=Funneliformis geosporum TaxID=1117311 RepID=A0A9W4SBH5_9GLOM|nr:16648_t:CDS:2 [Funneliformis geosporum]